jgi:hypothetical protein
MTAQSTITARGTLAQPNRLPHRTGAPFASAHAQPGTGHVDTTVQRAGELPIATGADRG